jgi:archaeal flagellar protein FlaJ
VILNPKGHGPGKRRFRPEEIQRYSVMAVGAGIAFVLLIVMLLVSTGSLSQIGGLTLIPSDGTDFFVFAVLLGVGPFAFFWARESRRIKGIDEKFPDFLRDLAESQRAGMTLPRALITASRGAYGPLTKEIQIMASQVEWGVSFNNALERFALRTRTPLINRTVSLITEAAASGGNVVDILTAASDDAREIKNIMTERKQQMAVYSMIVYIAFGVFLTVIAVLNSQFIPELAAATAGVGGGQSVGGIQFGEIDVGVYQRIFFHAALIQGIGGGLVSGVMTDGHPFAGLKHSMIMMMIAYAAFRFFIM